MKKEMIYPFEIVSIFLKSFSFDRKEEIPPNIPIPVKTKFKLLEPGFPKIQLNVLVETPTDLPISFRIEAVGLFNYIGEKQEYDSDINKNFIFKKGLHTIWPYISQIIKLFTSQMGMAPLNSPIPSSFEEVQKEENKN